MHVLALALVIGAATTVAPDTIAQTPGQRTPLMQQSSAFAKRPAQRLSPDQRPTEVGIRFSPTRTIRVVGVRFFKGGPDNDGRHVGRLRTAEGAQLARATFRSESRRGWQTATFDHPISIRPGRAYIASYRAPRGHYSMSTDTFVRKLHHRDFTLPKRAGIKRHTAPGAVADVTRTASNFFVDVLVDAGGQARSLLGPSPADPTGTTPPTATPTPNTLPVTQHNCADAPIRCGYPDAGNTGVPASVALKRIPEDVTSGPGWSYDSRGWVAIDTDGAVFDGYDLAIPVEVTAPNVVIRNCRVSVTGERIGIGLRHTNNVTIQDSQINSPNGGDNRLMVGIKDIYGDSTGLKILRTNIWNTSTAIQVESGLIRDNYIHDLGYKNGDHVNGTTSNGGTGLLTIDHNTVFNSYDQTDAISLFQDFGNQANRTISNNLLAGGGYTIYAGANPGKLPTSNITITNNRISRKYFPNGGSFGPITAYNANGTGNSFTGNIWDDTGKVLRVG